MPGIMMVNTVRTGSHGRLMEDLRAAAQADGMEAVIAYGRGAGAEGAIRIGGTAGVLKHVALTRAFDWHGRGSRGATAAFVETLCQRKPDLLHLHNVHGYYLHTPTLFEHIRASGVPVIWTLHDCWALTGHCSHFARAGCQRWKTGCYRCPLKGEYPASLLFDASRQNYRIKRAAFSGIPNLTIVTPSQWLAEVVSESYLRDTRLEVIPNGLDLTLFQPTIQESVREGMGVRPGQAMLLAVAAPFDSRKGYPDALAIAKRLGISARLVLVGLTEKQRRALPDTVTGILRTKGPEALVSLYGAADCLINPTYEETYPTVNMEAMACGTPVATYATGGCVEQITPPMGISVPCGDVGALAEAAMALSARRGELREACRAHAEREFDRAEAMRAYIALYKRMIGV